MERKKDLLSLWFVRDFFFKYPLPNCIIRRWIVNLTLSLFLRGIAKIETASVTLPEPPKKKPPVIINCFFFSFALTIAHRTGLSTRLVAFRDAKQATGLSWGSVIRVLTSDTIKHLIAGGAAGAVSRTIVSPLERMKILFQARPEYEPHVSFH